MKDLEAVVQISTKRLWYAVYSLLHVLLGGCLAYIAHKVYSN